MTHGKLSHYRLSSRPDGRRAGPDNVTVRPSVGLLFMALVVAGCGLLPGLEPSPTARACADVYTARRCDAILAQTAAETATDEDLVVAVEILPQPTRPPGLIDFGGPQFEVRLRLAEGPPRLATVFCGGIASASVPACVDDPRYPVYAPTGPSGGYRDLPCPGEPPDGCATPLPTLNPGALRAAQPLRIDERSIPINGTGPQEIEIGRGSLPNGVLTEATFELVDGWPQGLRLGDGVSLVVRPVNPARPPYENHYDHGWWPGVEEFVALIRLDLTRTEPGAVLLIRDVVVR